MEDNESESLAAAEASRNTAPSVAYIDKSKTFVGIVRSLPHAPCWATAFERAKG